MKIIYRIGSTALFAVMTPAVSASAPETPRGSFDVTAAPVRAADGTVSGFAVDETITAAASDTPPVFAAPFKRLDFRHFAESVSDLTMRDADGAVPVTVVDDPVDPADGYDRMRRWKAGRAVRYPLTVHYTMATGKQDEPGPPFATKQVGGGAVGSVRSIIVEPENLTTAKASFGWNMAGTPAGWVGIVGAGPKRVSVTGPASEIGEFWSLVGPARHFADLAVPSFNGYLLGTPQFAPAPTFAWAAKTYHLFAKLFGSIGEPPYALLMRAMAGPSVATATADRQGALYTTGNPPQNPESVDDVRATLAHEMIHQWVGQFDPFAPWFSEGATVFFAVTIPCQNRLLLWSSCADVINTMAKRYAISEGRHWPNTKIVETPFWYAETHNIRIIPYARGMLFLAELDERIRQRSTGRRGLIDALRPLFAAREKGHPIDMPAWQTLLRREAGEQAVADFQATVIDGTREPQPGSGAFGPCLERGEASFPPKDGGAPAKGFEWHLRADAPASCLAK